MLAKSCSARRPRPFSRVLEWPAKLPGAKCHRECQSISTKHPIDSREHSVLCADQSSQCRRIRYSASRRSLNLTPTTSRPQSHTTSRRCIVPTPPPRNPSSLAHLSTLPVHHLLRHLHHHGTSRSWRVVQQPAEEVQVRMLQQRRAPAYDADLGNRLVFLGEQSGRRFRARRRAATKSAVC